MFQGLANNSRPLVPICALLRHEPQTSGGIKNRCSVVDTRDRERNRDYRSPGMTQLGSPVEIPKIPPVVRQNGRHPVHCNSLLMQHSPLITRCCSVMAHAKILQAFIRRITRIFPSTSSRTSYHQPQTRSEPRVSPCLCPTCRHMRKTAGQSDRNAA